MNKELESAACHVCNNRVLIRDGGIYFDNFFSWARDLVNKSEGFKKLQAGDKRFVNAVTLQYLNQFQEQYARPAQSAVDFSQLMRDIQIDIRADCARYARIDENPVKDRFLALVSHSSCIYSYAHPVYEIALDKIRSPEQCLEWMMQLHEKTWFNHFGFVEIVRQLFGREGV